MKARQGEEDPNTFRSNPTGRETENDEIDIGEMETEQQEDGEYLAANAVKEIGECLSCQTSIKNS
jgi:hypothetical protein